MIKFLKEDVNPNEKRFNYGLINRNYDDDIVDYIIQCCKSLEILKYVKFLGYELVTDESKINMSDYIIAKSRNKSKKKDNTHYMHLKDSRVSELILRFKLECNDESTVITKKILVPIKDKSGYYTINGTKYILIYQIVDNSTYVNKSNLILKSMRPISIESKKFTAKSTDKENNEISAPVYTIRIYKKSANILLFYLAKMGLNKTLRYFSVDKIIKFVPSIEDKEKNIYFKINSSMYIECNRHFFEKYNYVKSIVFMFIHIELKKATFDDLYDRAYWTKLIGAIGTSNPNNFYEKGLNSIVFFERMIDNITRLILKLHNVNKMDSYSIIRWMIGNYNTLRQKDTLDLNNKRLRCSEYVTSLLIKEFNDRIDRVISLGNKVTLNKIREIFAFPGDILIRKLHKSGLLRYDDRVNDMDFFSKLKATFKGPNALGNSNENTISIMYRGINPSYIGKIDINVCGTSDPGTSVLLTPFCETTGLYFNDNKESESFKYIIDKDIMETFNPKKYNDLKSHFKDEDSYYSYLFNKMKDQKVIDLTVRDD